LAVDVVDEILLLDDDPEMLVFLEGILTSAGHTCHTETDPAVALSRIASRQEIRLVLSDVCMPSITGLQFIDRLHSLKLSWPAPKVLLLTGHPSLERAIDALRLGAQDFLVKPIRAPELIEAIARALSRSRADRAADTARPPEIRKLLEQAEELAQRLRTLAYANDSLGVGSVHAPASASQPASSATAPRHAVAAPPVARATAAAEPLSVLDTIEELRRLRDRYTGHGLDEIEWDLLLELLRAERLHQKLSVSALTISATGASATTSLRRVNHLVSRGYIERVPDATDARRDFVSLTVKSNELLADYLAQANDHLRNLVS
jgi:CheY-like chemotaxis protein/DNA-binding MarR family transcriptional regulator